MKKRDLINAVSEVIVKKKNADEVVCFTDSNITIYWHDDDQEFCLEGFRANNFVDGFWDYCSCRNLKHWIADLTRIELEKYLDCPQKFHVVL